MTVDNSDVVVVLGERVDPRMCCYFFDGGRLVQLFFTPEALKEVTPEMVDLLSAGEDIPGYTYPRLAPVSQEAA